MTQSQTKIKQIHTIIFLKKIFIFIILCYNRIIHVALIFHFCKCRNNDTNATMIILNAILMLTIKTKNKTSHGCMFRVYFCKMAGGDETCVMVFLMRLSMHIASLQKEREKKNHRSNSECRNNVQTNCCG